MKKKIIAALKVFVPLILGIILLWLLMRGYDLKDIYNKIANADFKWAILGIVTGLLANVNRSVRWNMLLKPLGYKPRLVNTLFSVLVGYFYNLVFPRMGEVTRCTMLTSYEKVPLDKSLGTVVTERVIDVLSLLICLVIVLVFEFQRVSKIVHDFILQPVLAKTEILTRGSATFYTIGIVVLLVIAIVVYVGWHYLRNTKIYTKLIGILLGFVDGIKSVGKLENKKWFLFHTVSMWFFYTLGVYFTFQCFGFTEGLSFFTAFVVMTFGAFGYVAPVQGGVGAYQFIVIQVLLLYGIADNNGLAFGWLAWGAQFVMVVLFGVISLILFPVINRAQLVSDESLEPGTK